MTFSCTNLVEALPSLKDFESVAIAINVSLRLGLDLLLPPNLLFFFLTGTVVIPPLLLVQNGTYSELCNLIGSIHFVQNLSGRE